MNCQSQEWNLHYDEDLNESLHQDVVKPWENWFLFMSFSSHVCSQQRCFPSCFLAVFHWIIIFPWVSRFKIFERNFPYNETNPFFSVLYLISQAGCWKASEKMSITSNRTERVLMSEAENQFKFTQLFKSEILRNTKPIKIKKEILFELSFETFADIFAWKES